MKLKLLHRRILGVLVLMLTTMVVKAQQDPIFTQYMSNPVVINPAYAGSSGNFNLSGIFRKQWVGFEQWSPTTNAISVNTPFLTYKVGLGFTFLNDEIGPISQNGLYLDYAYHLQFDAGNTLSLGLKAGFNHYRRDLSGLITNVPEGFEDINARFLPNFGIGVYFYKPNKYFLGVSIPKLLLNNLTGDGNSSELAGREDRFYYLTGGFVKKIDQVIKLKPSFMINYAYQASAAIDISSTVILYDRFWAGLTYRVGNAFSGLIKLQLNDRMQLGYSYDLVYSRLRSYNNGTHEVFISYDFSFKQKRVLSPRYF